MGVEQMRTKYKEIPGCTVELQTCLCSEYKTLYSYVTYLFKATRAIFAALPRFWKHLTLRRLMSYIYGALILDVSRSHTTTQHSR